VIEAMSCGTPVVTSDSTALAEVGRGAAILVDPLDVDAIAEAIRVAATEPERRDALRDAGLARAARYTWDATAKILAETYAALAR
jgi:glycosyltransferase involved in cell wall biosynthesis